MTNFEGEGTPAKHIRSLKQALDNLDTFTRQIEKESVPNLSCLQVENGKLVVTASPSLKKIVTLAYRNLVVPEANSHPNQVLRQILQSSDIIKSYYPLIQKMETGTIEQKTFATYAKEAIQRFNDTIEKAASRPHAWHSKVACLLYKKSGFLLGNRLVKIELPERAFVHIDFPQLANNPHSKKISPTLYSEEAYSASQKISTLRELVIPAFQIQQQTLELYYMKVIGLVERFKLMNNKEARQLILKTPPQISLDKQSHLLTIIQHLIPLPGQYIDVSATFGMEPRTLNYNIFLSDNLSIEAHQTGVPHPLQHNGWALPDTLVPELLHRPNRLQHFPKLHHSKLQCALNLLPNGPLTEKAKRLLQLKREAFDAHKKEFLEYHQDLALALATAAPFGHVPEGYAEAMELFFDKIQDGIAPYENLSQIYEKVMYTWVSIPQKSLEDVILNGDVTSFDEAQTYLRSQFAIAEITWSEKIEATKAAKDEYQLSALEYGLQLGQLLAPSIEDLILQQQSEILHYTPPTLTSFAKKIQANLYLQLWEFHHELTFEPTEIDFFRRLSHLLEEEITLYNTSNIENLHSEAIAIVKELETYYKERSLEE